MHVRKEVFRISPCRYASFFCLRVSHYCYNRISSLVSGEEQCSHSPEADLPSSLDGVQVNLRVLSLTILISARCGSSRAVGGGAGSTADRADGGSSPTGQFSWRAWVRRAARGMLGCWWQPRQIAQNWLLGGKHVQQHLSLSLSIFLFSVTVI